MNVLLLSLICYFTPQGLYAQAYGEGTYGSATYGQGVIHFGPVSLPTSGAQTILYTLLLTLTVFGVYLIYKKRSVKTKK